MSTEAALAGLLARQEITEILHRYCRATDRLDAELLRSCFHPDCTIEMGAFKGMADDYIDNRIIALGRTLDYESHFVTNVMIELHGDVAATEAMFQARHIWTAKSTGTRRTRLVEGRYLDRFERRNGAWKIAARLGLMPFIQEFDLTGVVPPSWQEKSGFFPADPIYGHLAGARG